MAGKGPGGSPQSMTVLQRLARLYEGERWWLSDAGDEVRGLLCLDGGTDLGPMRESILKVVASGHGFALSGEASTSLPVRQASPRVGQRHDCQVTMEERTQLFGFLKKG